MASRRLFFSLLEIHSGEEFLFLEEQIYSLSWNSLVIYRRQKKNLFLITDIDSMKK